jgi:hypothetical protein
VETKGNPEIRTNLPEMLRKDWSDLELILPLCSALPGGQKLEEDRDRLQLQARWQQLGLN